MPKQKKTNRPKPKAQIPLPSPVPLKVAPLFRQIDWLTALLTSVVMWLVYFLTLAPELTLQDSGELVTGSFYAGIPHPPGYPVWTIYSWLWTVLLPVGNMAWRVALGQATAGAIACGLLALMVSRGGSLIVEGIEELKTMTGQWENAICLVSGLVAGLLVGLDGFMWSESVVVNRISVFGVPWIMIVLLCLLRWIYAPHQLRYVYWAIFLFGVCFTIHQSLIVAAIGIEITIALAKPRLGRDMFLGNAAIYLLYNLHFLATGQHFFQNIGAKPGLLLLFHGVGAGSLMVSGWLAVKTKGLFSEWKPVTFMGLLWLLGISFYLYLPISGMTNPPMQWGYPRTVEGFFHALTRGQYEQPNPTNLLAEPGRFLNQMFMLIQGVAEEFNWVYLLIALVPFAFFRKMQKRERAWIMGLVAIYLCQGVLLMILLNPTPDRASADLVKVFFNSSHMVVAGLIGYGLALIAAFMATQYERFRRWGFIGGAMAAALALYCLWDATGTHYFGPAGHVSLYELPRWIAQAFARNQYGSPIYGSLIVVAIPFVFLLALASCRRRAPLALTLGLFAVMPLYSVLSHWADSEQRGHMFGYWFGHDMFTPPFQGPAGKPLYPPMAKDAILFGGTDPGRFCPTYMIFVESFTPHDCQPAEDQKFDRRDVNIITQNALADGTYLSYIRAHYNRSRQIDPPFFQELFRSQKKREQNQTNLLARLVSPLDLLFTAIGERVEKRRRTSTSWFTGQDFTDLPGLAARLCPGSPPDPLSQWLYENCSAPTRQLLSGPADDSRLRRSLATDLNRLLERELEVKRLLSRKTMEKQGMDQAAAAGQASAKKGERSQALAQEIAGLSRMDSLYQPERFKQVELSEYLTDFIEENPQGHTRIRLNRLLLEAAYPKQIRRSLGGVYPDREILTPTPDESRRAIDEYMADFQRRMQANQLKAGEDFKILNNRIQISGQVSVMQINALLTKLIFEQNPKNEFYVEESLALDWMYPYLTPFGIIMKINRQPLPELTAEIVRQDHEFWSQYSSRLAGNWITYDTPVQAVCDFVERVYLRGDLRDFRGDRKFIRDDDAQKAFSKLRSSIAGVYAWRVGQSKTVLEQQRMLKEADFAFRQAFCFCPYSSEALIRYVQLLASTGRIDDALRLTRTCYRFDPENKGVRDMISQLEGMRSGQLSAGQTPTQLSQLEQQHRANPSDPQLMLALATAYVQQQQAPKAVPLLRVLLANPKSDADLLINVARICAQAGLVDPLEAALTRLARLQPGNPEVWYDLAGVQATMGKNAAALQSLGQALPSSAQRLAQQPGAKDLRAAVFQDARFKALRLTPEFQKLLAPK